jgi:hypothetical protein
MYAKEWQIQRAIVEWIDEEWRHVRHCYFHPPNGGRRQFMTGRFLRRQGQKPGVPDLIFMRPCVVGRNLSIEIKRDKKSSVSASQQHWLRVMDEAGWCACVSRGYGATKDLIMEAYPEHDVQPVPWGSTREQRLEVALALHEIGYSYAHIGVYIGRAHPNVMALIKSAA